MAKGVAKMAKAIERLKDAGLASRTTSPRPDPLVRRHARSIGANLRRRTDEAKDEVMAINAKLVRIAKDAVREARRVAVERPSGAAPHGDCGPAQAASARARPRGDRRAGGRRSPVRPDSASPARCLRGRRRLVSLHDPDARPIRKGRLGKPVEFGYKAQVVDNEDGVILDHNVEIGNPPDAPMLVPAVRRITPRAGRAPAAVTADRGYGEAAIEDELDASWACATSCCRPRANRTRSAKSDRGPNPLPGARAVEDRERRPDQLPQTRLRLEPHTHRRDRGSEDLVRTRGVQPQPGEDRRTGGHQSVIGIRKSAIAGGSIRDPAVR